MSKFRILDPVRVTNPEHSQFDQVLTVRIISSSVWAHTSTSPELIPFHERDLILADAEREAAL